MYKHNFSNILFETQYSICPVVLRHVHVLQKKITNQLIDINLDLYRYSVKEVNRSTGNICALN